MSELVVQAVGIGPGRVAILPIAACFRFESPLHRITAGQPHSPGNRREKTEKEEAEDQRRNDAIEQFRQLHPGAVERRQPIGGGQRDQQEQTGRDKKPLVPGQVSPPEIAAGQGEDDDKQGAERTVGRVSRTWLLYTSRCV